MVHIQNLALLKKKISYKFSDYRKRDVKKGLVFHLTLADCVELVRQSDGICVECKCVMLFEEYKAWCLYQFTFDAIDPAKGHTKENLRIVCYDCNALGGKLPKGACSGGCSHYNPNLAL